MPAVTLTPAAKTDLVEIWQYTATTWGDDKADAYLDSLDRGFERLIGHPKLGVDYGHVLPGYRRLHIDHHGIFYKILEDEVLVVRVLHEEMDAPRHLRS